MKVRLVIVLICMAVMCMGCEDDRQANNEQEKITVSEIPTTTEKVIVEKKDEVTEINTENKEDIAGMAKKFLIAIDPGHQGPNVDMSAKEPIAPGSTEMKTKATGGTIGQYSSVPEYQLNLEISLKLRDALRAQGYDVIMTREDNDTAISNAERAMLANDNGADVSIRIHANGSDDHSVNGALAMVGSESNQYVGHLYNDSYELAEDVLSSYCDLTGMNNLGVQATDTMTGINWSEIPVIILEMGFMSNESDDINMQDSDYQDRMVLGIVDGVNQYFSSRVPKGKAKTERNDDSMEKLYNILQTIVDDEIAKGNSIAVGVGKMNSTDNVLIGNKPMQSASLIKLYVAACVYERNENNEMYIDSETEDLLANMLRVSDNDACNTLVRKIGDGDVVAGMQRINDFCKEHGLTDTSMGRLMLDFESDSDNYTSVADCTAFLQSVYNGRIAGSESILGYLKQQERTGKIPGGVPDGVMTANKTGELDTVENDTAIVFADSGAYVITVMMSDLSDTAEARETIKKISKEVYEFMMH